MNGRITATVAVWLWAAFPQSCSAVSWSPAAGFLQAMTPQLQPERIEVTKASVRAAEEALRLVTLQWQAGTITVIRYIDANVDRDQAHSLAIAARYDALRAEAGLKKATGIWR